MTPNWKSWYKNLCRAGSRCWQFGNSDQSKNCSDPQHLSTQRSVRCHENSKKFTYAFVFLQVSAFSQCLGSGSGRFEKSDPVKVVRISNTAFSPQFAMLTCPTQLFVQIRVVDPDTDWIRIQRLVWIWIRIGNPDPGARKLRNFSGKNALFSYFLKKFYH
jgi:hypothetical protein